jgi:hypothetical protein
VALALALELAILEVQGDSPVHRRGGGLRTDALLGGAVNIQEWFTLARDVSLVLVAVLGWLMAKERAAVMKAIADERKEREREMDTHKDQLTLQLDLMRAEITNDIQRAEERTRHTLRGEFQHHTAQLMSAIVDLKDDRRR